MTMHGPTAFSALRRRDDAFAATYAISGVL